MSHEEFIAAPRTRLLRRSGGRVYYVWDGRSFGLGEKVLGRDPVEANRLRLAYEGVKEAGIDGARGLGRDRRRIRAPEDPIRGLPLWAKNLFSNAETRCRHPGARGSREFSLTPGEFAAIVERANGRCEVTGIAFDDAPTKGRSMRPFSPSLDRIDSTLGYVAGNVRLVALSVNFAMNRWGEGPLRVIAAALTAQKAERVPPADAEHMMNA